MEIKTKFDVGDRIYPIRYFNDEKKFCREKDFIVDAININTEKEIQYFDGWFYYNEINCFATKEEAQKECDKRNGTN